MAASSNDFYKLIIYYKSNSFMRAAM